MTMNIRHSILLLLLLTPIGQSPAQKTTNVTKMPVQMVIPPVASLSLTGADLRFSIEGKGTQQIITPTTVGKVWLNYSSVVENNSTNAICASLSSGFIPAEVSIKLKVGPDAGQGQGQVGTPTGVITLSPYPQPIIAHIGTCYTGQGVNKGHPLTYTWELHPDYDNEFFSESDLDSLKIGVIYTITTNE
jgi:hypothetical protein